MTTKERLGLAGVCQGKKLHHTAAGLYAAAFAADPKLADDLKAAHRYNAACYAALAAAGQGEDAAKLDDKEKTRLRKQALDWLRADLALRTKQLESGKPADRAEVQQTMRHWQQGHRPGRHPRRGRPGQAPRGRTEGVYPTLGRRGAAEEGGGKAEVGIGKRHVRSSASDPVGHRSSDRSQRQRRDRYTRPHRVLDCRSKLLETTQPICSAASLFVSGFQVKRHDQGFC